ncbi:hypothetical protein GCM10022224_087840 [Nonomuraea antimicrobica]|uniref:Uncharacterized protein n=1 Tax=Nonomuraea antimicrobica TaxID=561173 RepID=A0ABP7DR50_9ACTN
MPRPLEPTGASVTLLQHITVPAQDGIRTHEEAQPTQDLAGQRNGPELLELRCEPQSSGVFSIGFTT